MRYLFQDADPSELEQWLPELAPIDLPRPIGYRERRRLAKLRRRARDRDVAGIFVARHEGRHPVSRRSIARSHETLGNTAPWWSTPEGRRTWLDEITEESVERFARHYMNALPEMLTEAIVEVFEWLRPREQHIKPRYKRNSELEVPAKVVLTGMVERHYMGTGFRLRGYRDQRLTALENVFTALDGRGQINKRNRSELEDGIDATKTGIVETPHFRVRCFKNGNLHLQFRRPDLLARFNQIAGGARLRPAA